MIITANDLDCKIMKIRNFYLTQTFSPRLNELHNTRVFSLATIIIIINLLTLFQQI